MTAHLATGLNICVSLSAGGLRMLISHVAFRVDFLDSSIVYVYSIDAVQSRVSDFFHAHWRVLVVEVAESFDSFQFCSPSGSWRYH